MSLPAEIIIHVSKLCILKVYRKNDNITHRMVKKKFVGKQMENEQNQIQFRKMSKVHSSCVEDYGHFNYILTGEWTRKISPAPNNRYLHCDEIQHEIGSSAVGGGQSKLLVEIG